MTRAAEPTTPVDGYTQSFREYVFSTTIVPANPAATSLVDPLLQGIRDPNSECRHERLPGDPDAPCGCWPEEGPVLTAPDLMGVLHDAQENKENTMETTETPAAP